MKAIVIPEPGRVEVKELPMVQRREGEAVLKLLYGGVCGSDLGTYLSLIHILRAIPLAAWSW